MKRIQSFRASGIVFAVLLAVTGVRPTGALASDRDTEDPLLLTDGVSESDHPTISRASASSCTTETASTRSAVMTGEDSASNGDNLPDGADGDPAASSEEGDPTAPYFDSDCPDNIGKTKWSVKLNANNPFMYPQNPAPACCRYNAPKQTVMCVTCVLPINGNLTGIGRLCPSKPTCVKITITSCCPNIKPIFITVKLGCCYSFSTLKLTPCWTGNSTIKIVPVLKCGKTDPCPCHTTTIKINLM